MCDHLAAGTYCVTCDMIMGADAIVWPFDEHTGEPLATFEAPPPRHSADDYRAIAERLKQLGYRGWITG